MRGRDRKPPKPNRSDKDRPGSAKPERRAGSPRSRAASRAGHDGHEERRPPWVKKADKERDKPETEAHHPPPADKPKTEAHADHDAHPDKPPKPEERRPPWVKKADKERDPASQPEEGHDHHPPPKPEADHNPPPPSEERRPPWVKKADKERASDDAETPESSDGPRMPRPRPPRPPRPSDITGDGPLPPPPDLREGAPLPPPPGPPPVHHFPTWNIIALDGGMSAHLTVKILAEVESRMPGFLASADMFAGTSAGAINSLALACHDEPKTAIGPLLEFWNLYSSWAVFNSVPGYLSALAGMGPIFSNNRLKKTLEKFLFGKLTLGEIKRRALVVGFNVNNRQLEGPKTHTRFQRMDDQNWGPALISNLDDQFTDLPLTDAALSSGSFPVFAPVYRGHVDGGLATNSPAAVAVGRVAQAIRDEGFQDVLGLPEMPGDPASQANAQGHGMRLGLVRVLSVGTGMNRVSLNLWNGYWGYWQWLLNPLQPLLLLNAFYSGTTSIATLNGRYLLPQGNFHRLNPFFTHTGLIPFVQASIKKQDETLNSIETQQQVTNTVNWLVSSDWMREQHIGISLKRETPPPEDTGEQIEPV